MDKLKFSDLKWEKHAAAIEYETAPKSVEKIMRKFKDSMQTMHVCTNGLTVSILKGKMFYSNGKDTYEAWVLGDKRFPEPEGYLTANQVIEYIEKAEAL